MKIRYYMGYDPVDTLAFEVAASSCLAHASCDVQIIPVKDWELRHVFKRGQVVNYLGQRRDDQDGLPVSTAFSYTRYLIPYLENYGREWVVWSDPDVLWRSDIAELYAFSEASSPACAMWCVKHDHRPSEAVKMVGQVQRVYERKNWSSVMLIKPNRNRYLTPYRVNKDSKDDLHSLRWLADDEIGALPETWNWLCGWSSEELDPDLVHFTRGTPDMVGHEDEPFADEWVGVIRSAGIKLASFPFPA